MFRVVVGRFARPAAEGTAGAGGDRGGGEFLDIEWGLKPQWDVNGRPQVVGYDLQLDG